MVILGIDPGLAETGYGVVEWRKNRSHARQYGCIRTPADQPLAERVAHIHAEVAALIAQHQPEALVLEKLFALRDGRAGLSVGNAMGVILLAAAQAHLSVHEYAPAQVKQAVVGYGDASKEQVQYMVRQLLGLEELPHPDHAADALALCLCHLHTGLGRWSRVVQPPTPVQERLAEEMKNARRSRPLQKRIAQAVQAEEERRRAYQSGKQARQDRT